MKRRLTWDIINTKNDAEAAFANPGDLNAQTEKCPEKLEVKLEDLRIKYN